MPSDDMQRFDYWFDRIGIPAIVAFVLATILAIVYVSG